MPADPIDQALEALGIDLSALDPDVLAALRSAHDDDDHQEAAAA